MTKKIKMPENIKWIKEKEIKIGLNLSFTFWDMEVTCLTTIRAKIK